MDKELIEFMSDYAVITRTEYNALKDNNNLFYLLVEAIKTAVKFDYSGEKIDFPYGQFDAIIKTLLPDTYDEIITKLQADKELEGDFGA